jgi:long-chain acyl-CoA synthetase
MSDRWIAAERSTRTSTMSALALAAPAKHAQFPALRSKQAGTWTDLSYPLLGERIREYARSLLALGIAPGDRVAVFSETCPEWTCVDLAALACGAVLVPIYPTTSSRECAYLLAHSEARIAFCATTAQATTLTEAISRDRPLEHVVAFSSTTAGTPALPLEDFASYGSTIDEARVYERAARVTPSDLCTLVYTSGTTGKPKGCVLTHANIRANLDMLEAVIPTGKRPILFAFLPLAHMLTRMLQMYTLDVGGTLAYWDGQRETLLADLATVRPTQFPAVPRLYEKVYAAINDSVERSNRARRDLFRFSVAAGRDACDRDRRDLPRGILLRVKLAIANRLLLTKVRDAFGGQLEVASTGAAPMDATVLEFFNACGVSLMEGYGLTESTAVATINTPTSFKLGTVGKPLPGSRLALSDDGEVLIAGPHIFGGYYKDPQATAEALIDGVLHTGDLGAVDADGFLTITGRKKDLIITSSGKNVSPAKIENALRQQRWISQAVVCGERRPFLVALLTLDHEDLPALARHVDAPGDGANLASHAAVRAVVEKAVANVNKDLARIEQIKRFIVLPYDFSEARGELTPTLKPKRATIYDRYAPQIMAMYENRPPVGVAVPVSASKQ